jgi:hypothetical protein
VGLQQIVLVGSPSGDVWQAANNTFRLVGNVSRSDELVALTAIADSGSSPASVAVLLHGSDGTSLATYSLHLDGESVTLGQTVASAPVASVPEPLGLFSVLQGSVLLVSFMPSVEGNSAAVAGGAWRTNTLCAIESEAEPAAAALVSHTAPLLCVCEVQSGWCAGYADGTMRMVDHEATVRWCARGMGPIGDVCSIERAALTPLAERLLERTGLPCATAPASDALCAFADTGGRVWVLQADLSGGLVVTEVRESPNLPVVPEHDSLVVSNTSFMQTPGSALHSMRAPGALSLTRATPAGTSPQTHDAFAAEIDFVGTALCHGVTSVCAVDTDLDGVPEIVAVTLAGVLVICKNTDEGYVVAEQHRAPSAAVSLVRVQGRDGLPVVAGFGPHHCFRWEALTPAAAADALRTRARLLSRSAVIT